MQQQLNEVQGKLDESNRTLNDFDSAKKKLSIENSDYLRQLEDAESQVAQLNKLKVSLTTQLEDTKRMADEEGRERATLLGKFRNLEHDIDGIREQLEEESEAKVDLQRQLSKANAEAQMWRTKYESEGVAKAEELEEAKSVPLYSLLLSLSILSSPYPSFFIKSKSNINEFGLFLTLLFYHFI